VTTEEGFVPEGFVPEEFEIEIIDDDVADLRERLGRTRWPDAETVDDWSQGVPLAYVQELCAYWRDGYDFQEAARRLNRVPHRRAEIDGLGIHFVHRASPEPDAFPLVVTHGWPGSVVEFLDVVDRLADPVAHGGDAADAFHVVCPSLPGYGWSDRPTRTGWGVERTAAAWSTLMHELGYDTYGAQGGDWGAFVSTAVGKADPQGCIGVHLNLAVARPDADALSELTDREAAALADVAHYDQQESGYYKQQATRPQTLGYGLADSPAAQCAWIVEKLYSWSDCDGHPEHVFTKDQLLDNVMAYWLTDTGASSARMYWESSATVDATEVATPTAITIFPREIFRTSRRWAERRFLDLRYWNEVDRGGHFAAFEQPELFVTEVRAAFRALRA
jgi:pimeloyl-ACP methyl ester carboxylesterase